MREKERRIEVPRDLEMGEEELVERREPQNQRAVL
jgi:hypothetical protein